MKHSIKRSMKRSSKRPDSALLRIPQSLLALVCSFLDVPPALVFLTRVLRMPGLKVPWSRIAEKFVRLPGPTLAISLRVALLPQLLVLEVSIKEGNFCYLQPVLNGASGLGKLSLSIASAVLNALVCITVPPGLRELSMFVDGPPYHQLADFLRAVPTLSSLSLSFRRESSTGSWYPYFFPANVMLSVASGSLQSLSLDGTIIVGSAVLDTITTRFPDLLDLDLTVIIEGGLDALARLNRLKTCSLRLFDVIDLSFMKVLPSQLEVLRVWLKEGDELVLPPRLRELCCASREMENAEFLVSFSPAAAAPPLAVLDLPAASLLACPPGLLTSVHTLRCTANVSTLADVLRLAAGLRSLRDLWLSTYESDAMKLFKKLCSDVSFPEFSVARLKLEQEVEGWTWTWLRAFPQLSRLECRRARNGHNDAYVHAFRSCPSLQELVDSNRQAVTIQRRQDGQLVKRQDDKSETIKMI